MICHKSIRGQIYYHNTNYNINTNNTTLELVDYAANTQKFTITPGNYTVTTFLTALSAALANSANIFLGMTVTYSDLTTCLHLHVQILIY